MEALAALDESRLHGYRRGLVVLATGLGKTWLAAFDVKASPTKRVLFVAHREDILYQAATFVRIGEGLRVGFYKGQQRDVDVDVLCASIQTIGRSAHLEQFATTHFDYIVVDEFHHAAAPS
ncbi:DEAD/DEAH box helicase family protein [Allohahella marinimesophila]|uniref:Helicase/UvrB N-terminal domain-containing protein n=1 Tax=Allohahella marinimesophila TaxID=1054972 RepID=A0ABP7Q6R3_9GAMM